MKNVTIAAALIGLAVPALAGAAEFQTPGALGMGRAGVARTTDAYALFWNPAGLAFYEKPFSTRLNAGVGVSISESLADNVDKVGKLDLGNSKLNYSTPTEAVAATARAVQFTGLVNDLAKNKGDLAINVDAALGFQYRNYGLGLGVATEMGAGIGAVDTQNLRVGSSTSSATTVGGLAADLGATSPARTANLFSTTQYNNVVTALQNAGGTLTDSQRVASTLEAQLAKENKTALSSEQLSQAMITMAGSLNKGGIDSNQTSVDLRGLLLAEVPLGYGYKFDFGPLGKVGVGGAVKVMQGTVYGQVVEIMKIKDSNDLVKKVKDTKSDSTTVGLDLGLLWRYEEIKALGPINVALVGKNLNSPEFDAPVAVPGFTKVKVEPQVRFGVALDPFSFLSIAADLDVTKNKTILPGRDSQNIGAGVDFHPFSFFAVRAGLFDNLAISSSSPVLTAGLTLGPRWFRFDLDAAVSTETGKFDNQSYPREAKVEFGLSTMF